MLNKKLFQILFLFKVVMSVVKIIAPVGESKKSFNSTEDFSDYFNTHKDEMLQQTTQKLNKMFSVNGYRITKIGTRD